MPRKNGLPGHIQKQVLQDIEESGGLSFTNLDRLCKRKPEIFGKTNSPLRRQIQNKVARWKKLERVDCYKLLLNLEVRSPQKDLLGDDDDDEHEHEHIPSPPHEHIPSPPHEPIMSNDFHHGMLFLK